MVGPAPEDWSVDADEAAAYPVLPGLWQLRLPVAWMDITHVNAYLLERSDGGVTLVDCGSSGADSCWEALATAIRRTDHEVAEIRELVITHAHSDHFGLARQVVDESGCTMLMHPAHEAFTDGLNEPERIYAARGRRALREGVPPELVHLYADVREETEGAQAPIPPFTALHEGMGFDSVHGRWAVIETPGHAPSHLVFYQPESRMLIAGDLVSRFFAPWFDYGYTHDSVAEFAASLDRVAQLAVDVALAGHGRPIEDFAELVQMHKKALQQRLAEVKAAIGGGATNAYEICERVFEPTQSDEARVWRLAEIAAYLRHLRLAGCVVRDETRDVYFYRLAA